jgi:hypothetical protein
MFFCVLGTMVYLQVSPLGGSRDEILANSKTQNAFLFPVHAMFRHDCPLAVKSASTPQRLGHKKSWRDSLPVDMLPFGVTIPATVPQIPQRSEIPEGLMNYPVH